MRSAIGPRLLGAGCVPSPTSVRRSRRCEPSAVLTRFESGDHMLRRATVLAFLTALGAATAPAGSAAETVTGQVIDLACYMLDSRNTVPTHTGRGYACAQACAKEGFQVGLLTSDGHVFE